LVWIRKGEGRWSKEKPPISIGDRKIVKGYHQTPKQKNDAIPRLYARIRGLVSRIAMTSSRTLHSFDRIPRYNKYIGVLLIYYSEKGGKRKSKIFFR
jgi:hypothetical protein